MINLSDLIDLIDLINLINRSPHLVRHLELDDHRFDDWHHHHRCRRVRHEHRQQRGGQHEAQHEPAESID